MHGWDREFKDKTQHIFRNSGCQSELSGSEYEIFKN